MKNVVYFPSFEPPTENWLKFAMLYMEDFSPIIPNARYHMVSPEFRHLHEETDLIKPYNPTYSQGQRASINAIEFMDKLSNKPHLYSTLFNRVNAIRSIQEPKNRSFIIYNEKFSIEWLRYVTDMNFGTETDEGILVSRELAFIYMAYLADEIAHEDGKSVITDDNAFDNFLHFNKISSNPLIRRKDLATGVLSLVVPRDISTIPFTKLIKFRNRNINLIKAFNKELTLSLDNIQEGLHSRDFINSFNDIYSELSYEILAQGAGILTIPLSTLILFHNPEAMTPEYINLFINSLGISLNARGSISRTFKEVQNKRLARNYLTNLGRMS